MREIKFRGKRVDNGEWVYGNLIMNTDGEMYVLHRNYFEEDGHHLSCNSDTPIFTQQETVGQYTGLKDKNGVDIYEGDIVKYFNNEENGIFKTEYDNCRFYGTWLEATFPNILTELFYLGCSKELEVIGNIHDNTESKEE